MKALKYWNFKYQMKLLPLFETFIAQKMKFPIKNLFSKCDQNCSFLRIWSYLLKKSLMENSIFLCIALLYSMLFSPELFLKKLYPSKMKCFPFFMYWIWLKIWGNLLLSLWPPKNWNYMNISLNFWEYIAKQMKVHK